MPIDPPERGPLTQRTILLFWAPLAATWLMMAAEGPFLAAVIARLADPKLNLAAYGVAIAFALLVESPVMMLLSAATALVEDATSYRKLRAFANGLNALGTGALLIVLAPPVFRFVAETALALPEEVAGLTRDALWLFLPWPAAIGYRRFLQGVLIRSNRTRLVAVGTVVRLAAMTAAALGFGFLLGWPGARVGAAALSTAVVVEAAAARWMARHAIRALLEVDAAGSVRRKRSPESPPEGPPARGPEGPPARDPEGPPARDPSEPPVGGPAGPPARHPLGFREIAGFYYPLALTSLIGLAVQPMLTFFMGRAPHAIESLAVFPVVGSLSFLFRALGLAYQDAAIALLGRRQERFPELLRFAAAMGTGATLLLGGIVLTPFARVWFETISGLSPELARFAFTPARFILPIPLLTVFFTLQRAVLMNARRTRPITVATLLEILSVAALFPALAWGVGTVGVTAAFVAFVGGRGAANLYLLPRVRAAVGQRPAAIGCSAGEGGSERR